MNDAPPAIRGARGVLGLAAVVLVAAIAAILSPLGDAFTRDLQDKPIVQSLDKVRFASLEPGFRLHADPQGRFTVGVPPGYELDLVNESSWRFAGPVLGGLPTYVILTVGPDRVDLAGAGALRDKRIAEGSNLAYLLLASDPGELDGRPALNRAFSLGGYRGWEVVSLSKEGWVALTFLCHGDAFFQNEVDFRKVLASFRLVSAPVPAA